jgi:hypothetical protein
MDPIVAQGLSALTAVHIFDSRVSWTLAFLLLYAVSAFAAVALLWLGYGTRLAPERQKTGLATLLGIGFALVLGLFAWVLPGVLQYATTLAPVLPFGLRILVWLQSFPSAIPAALIGLSIGLALAWLPLRQPRALTLLVEALAGMNLLLTLFVMLLCVGLNSLHSMMHQLLTHF